MGLLDNKELLEDYRQHWSKRYGRPLSDAELEEIYRNLNGFFDVLLDWHMADKAKAAEQERLKKELESGSEGQKCAE